MALIVKYMTLWGEEEVGSKVCDTCFEEKPLDEYEPNRKFHLKNNPDGRVVRRPTCKKCRSHKKPLPSHIKKLYPKPKGDYFACPSCNKERKTSNARLDHDHHTNEVYGYICDQCNTGFGRFNDDMQTMINAIEWRYNVKITVEDRE